jgi:hypothetical protein
MLGTSMMTFLLILALTILVFLGFFVGPDVIGSTKRR